jgi:hypothetical protein
MLNVCVKIDDSVDEQTLEVAMHPDFPEEWIRIKHADTADAVKKELVLDIRMAKELVKAIQLIQKVQNERHD